MSTSTTKRRGSLTAEADEEVRDVEHVRRVARRVVVHPVRLPALVRDDVEQDVHRAVAVLRRGAVPTSARAPACQYLPGGPSESGEEESRSPEVEEPETGKRLGGWGRGTHRTGTRRTTALAPGTPSTASSPSRFVRPYRLSGFVRAEGVYGGDVPSNT